MPRIESGTDPEIDALNAQQHLMWDHTHIWYGRCDDCGKPVPLTENTEFPQGVYCNRCFLENHPELHANRTPDQVVEAQDASLTEFTSLLEGNRLVCQCSRCNEDERGSD